MRLKINDKETEIDFWDFVKNVFLAELTIMGLSWLAILLLAFFSFAFFA